MTQISSSFIQRRCAINQLKLKEQLPLCTIPQLWKWESNYNSPINSSNPPLFAHVKRCSAISTPIENALPDCLVPYAMQITCISRRPRCPVSFSYLNSLVMLLPFHCKSAFLPLPQSVSSSQFRSPRDARTTNETSETVTLGKWWQKCNCYRSSAL